MLVGGAVTSILTKKDINDFDIYFKDKDSFHLALLDIRNVKDKLDDEEFPVDEDIYHQYLDAYDFHYVCHTEKSVTFKPKHSEALFQLIHQNFYKDINEVFNDFDFTINMVGYDFELDEVVVHKEAMLHLSQRILVTNSGTKYPLISVLRTNKYQERGYTISKKELIKLLLSVNKLEINSYEDVGKHIGGLYGTLNVAEVFDTTKEFSLDEAIGQLSELDFDSLDSIKSDKPPTTFDDALLDIMLGDYSKEVPYTKRVNKDLSSYYDRNYKYVVGEVHYPKNSSESNSGIYCAKGYPDVWYGDVVLEVEPLHPEENTSSQDKFGYKKGVLVKQVLPFNDKEQYCQWLVDAKGIPVESIKYLKYI